MNQRASRAGALRIAAAAAVFAFAMSAIACATDEKSATKETAGKPAKEELAATPAKDAAASGTVTKEATPVKEATPANEATPVKEAQTPGTMPVKPEKAPDRVQVQHILIGFQGSVPGKNITRTREEANALAYEILERARKGEDFGTLVRKHTDDAPPGIYGMVNSGLTPSPGEFSRDGMVPAFGNVGFNISPGNIGIADHDKATSPYGWHIIKRLK